MIVTIIRLPQNLTDMGLHKIVHRTRPIVIVAGIITGNKVRMLAMSPITKDYLEKFWELIVVIFSILVQKLTVGRIARKLSLQKHN